MDYETKSLLYKGPDGNERPITHISRDTFIFGDIPDFVEDPTKMFSIDTLPLIVAFIVDLESNGVNVVSSLKTTFDPKVAPVRFVRTEFGKRPPVWINTQYEPFPSDRISDL